MNEFQQRPSKEPESSKSIITVPLNYTYYIKPENVLFESLVESQWRVEPSSTATSNPLFQTLPTGSLIYDNLSQLRRIVNQINESYASFGIMTIMNEYRTIDSKLTVSIIGNHAVQTEMNDIRLLIFKSFYEVNMRKISISYTKSNYCFNSLGQFKNEFLSFLTSLSTYNECSIYIVASDEQAKFDLVILGTQDQSNVTENKIRLFIDKMNPQLYCDYLEIDSLSLLPLIGGIEFTNFKRIIKQTNCHIYLPNLIPEIYYSNSLSKETGKPKLYITGLKTFVLLTKTMLATIVQKIAKVPFISQLSVMPIKRESLILFHKDHEFLKNIMFETGCFISIPPLGYGSKDGHGDIISFQGNSIEEVEMATDKFMSLMSCFYSAKYQLNTAKSSSTTDINKLLTFTDQLSFNSDTIVSLSKFNDDWVFQVIGRSSNIKIANQSLTHFASFIEEEQISSSVQYQIELPNKEKEFIVGKKNGKIIKIMNMSSVSIKLLPFSDYSFIVEISCNDVPDSATGLNLFEDELPTMLTFNVPESFHRQIIGVGGQTVQSIMRKFNVFIKFSNSFELNEKNLEDLNPGQSANFQQSFIRKNNVVIKCPSKNKSQIPLAKLELEKLVDKVINNNYYCSVFKLTSTQWNLLTSSQFNMNFNVNRKKPTNFITELEKLTNTYIKFPKLDQVQNDQAYVDLEIYGIENNSNTCCTELVKFLPYEYKLTVSDEPGLLKDLVQISRNSQPLMSRDLSKLELDFLNSIVTPLKMLYNVELEMNQGSQSIILKYYPESFGITSSPVATHGTPNTFSGRLSKSAQQDIVQKEEFQQIIQSLNKFLNDYKMNITSKEVKECEVNSGNKETILKLTEKENLMTAVSNSKFKFNNQFIPSSSVSASTSASASAGFNLLQKSFEPRLDFVNASQQQEIIPSLTQLNGSQFHLNQNLFQQSSKFTPNFLPQQMQVSQSQKQPNSQQGLVFNTGVFSSASDFNFWGAAGAGNPAGSRWN
ncbi:hypothetical protein CANARDRAFT_26178 [[Candida] arabinofermentans NRRL YB-2248]|uniref:K Homology domain-containing protein n=1 Tax=[Candida] arabinofermentans NRRL YB-2248 TaxID=983967 RepID=A0A1E4T8E8_9ASCO|nr:hypothetical protein CANARDRAFT_26178 [[Candida] arabinofermentans NRRL YB-2248]